MNNYYTQQQIDWPSPLCFILCISILALISISISTFFWVKAMLRYGKENYQGSPPGTWVSYLPWPAAIVSLTSIFTIPLIFSAVGFLKFVAKSFVDRPIFTLLSGLVIVVIAFSLFYATWKLWDEGKDIDSDDFYHG